MKRISVFAKAFLVLCVFSGGAAFALYFGLRAFFGKSPVLFCCHGRPYYDDYPIQFLFSLVIIFAWVSSIWLVFVAPRVKGFQWFQIGIIPFLTIVVTGPIWGLLAVYYDGKAHGFPHSFSPMINYFAWGAQIGFQVAPLSAVYSFPINLFSYAIACSLLFALIRSSIFRTQREATQ